MSETRTLSGAEALQALLSAQAGIKRLEDKDFSEAVVLLARKPLQAPGTKLAHLRVLREAIGDALFEQALTGLSAHRLKLLVRRLDKSADATTAEDPSAARRFVRQLLDLPQPASEPPVRTPAPRPTAEAAPAEPAQTEAAETAPPKTGAYFGRKSFRGGD